MVGSRTATALVVGAASVALSVLVYVYTGSLLFFLVLPFVPFFFRGREEETGTGTETDVQPVFECPRCGFSTRNPEFEYCPRDGSRLHERGQR